MTQRRVLLTTTALLWCAAAPAGASNADNYFCRGCATTMEHVWRGADPMVARISSRLTAGAQANASLDIKGLVVDNM